MSTINKNLIILYGSQTGNAQDIAERVWRKCKYYNINVELFSFDTFDLKKLKQNKKDEFMMLCVCSTTGQGDTPDNMVTFWNKIMKKSFDIELINKLEFGVIGLGDSSYEKYNFIAKKLFRRFIQLGGRPLLDICLCDEQHPNGIEKTFLDWINAFWLFLVPSGVDLSKENKFISMYKLNFINDDNEINCLKSLEEEEDEETEANELFPYEATLVKNERITPEKHWQAVHFIEFDCSESSNCSINYSAGDILMIKPSNTQHTIKKFLEVFQHLNIDFNQRISIEDISYLSTSNLSSFNNNKSKFKHIKTIGDLIYNYFDLNSIPRMSFFEMLSKLSEDELEKEKLVEFIMTPEGLEDLYKYCYRPRRTIMEIFYDFNKTAQSIKSIDILLNLIPQIKPRAFSIASSPSVHKKRIQLLVAIVEYKTRLYETRKGTCSYWLKELKINNNDDNNNNNNNNNNKIKIPVWIKKGSFKYENDPIIYVGPGTGVAPFRSIINERINTIKDTKNYLYFGCRNKKMDFFFENEWLMIQNKYNNVLELKVAFSRDTPTKIYVQDILMNDYKLIYDLILNKNAIIMIAGSSNRMPQDVIATLEKIYVKVKKENDFSLDNDELINEAKEWIKYLDKYKRLQLETWS